MGKPEPRAVILSESQFAEWNQLVASCESGSIYARPEYLDALCGAAGGRFRVLAIRQGDVLMGGVGLYERRSGLGTHVSPRLLLYYNGPILRTHDSKYPSERTAKDLKTLTALEDELRRCGYDSIVLKPRSPVSDVRPFIARGWAVKHGYTYVVEISDLAQARARIEQNLRRLIDRCASGEFVFAEDDDFDSFFALHSRTMERVDFRVYLPVAAFSRLYHTLARQGLAKLYHARLSNGLAVASQLVLLGHPVTHTVSAGADPEHLKSGVTAFLRWRVFERLSQLGYRANDLTDAALNPVTHFKSQLGGRLESWLELRSPESARYRVGTGLQRVAERLRGAAGSAARRVLKSRGRTVE